MAKDGKESASDTAKIQPVTRQRQRQKKLRKNTAKGCKNRKTAKTTAKAATGGRYSGCTGSRYRQSAWQPAMQAGVSIEARMKSGEP